MMRLFIFGFILASFSIVGAEPALACGKDHGYTSTAEILRQSDLPLKEKEELAHLIAQSEDSHDKYTKTGNYIKVNEAVSELIRVNKALSR